MMSVGNDCPTDPTGLGSVSDDQRHRFNAEMQNRIRQEYAYHAVARQQRAQGRTVQRREFENGEIEVVIGGYR